MTLYQRRRAAGMCGRCGRMVPPHIKATICPKCRKQNIAGSRNHYRRMKAEGRCVNCASRLPPGWTPVRCSSCLGKDMAAHVKRVEAEAAEPVADVPRCRCGLALPCNSCLPSIDFYATSRRGPGYAMPDPGGASITSSERRRMTRTASSKFSPRALQHKVRLRARTGAGRTYPEGL